MRIVRLIAPVALLGGIVTMALFFAGFDGAGAGALVLAGIAITSGFTAVSGPLGDWGVPGDTK